ncbi:hypothetical protein PoB_001217600 [Plakobranchus ocellatus]|uniref:Uncharacterized protein n=1 Tax=Plakobranchus ocellatus TaxID=259542 RepID=A0AAV3YEC0_9GAST|nr:hypothetical protein PoB_001217600 [Plakobranchus ocellatus]
MKAGTSGSTKNTKWNRSNSGVLSVEWCKDLVHPQLADIPSGSGTEHENIGNRLHYCDASDGEDDISDSETDSNEEELMN